MTYVSKPQSYFISSYMYYYHFTCIWVILSVVNIQNHAVTFNNELMVPVNRIITLKAHNWSSPHFCFEHILIILDNYYSPERNLHTLMKLTFSTLWTHLQGMIPPSKTYSPKAFFFFFFLHVRFHCDIQAPSCSQGKTIISTPAMKSIGSTLISRPNPEAARNDFFNPLLAAH